MRVLKITLSYDGTEFAGWQVQPNRRTVQGNVETALKKITSDSIHVVGSGRTDAGVHALGQVASCDTQSSQPCAVLTRALNGTLPHDIVVLDVQDAFSGFHAIRDALRKTYRYVIHDGPVTDVFLQRYSWRLPLQLDHEAMDRGAQRLQGTHDFASFESSGSSRASTVRTVERIRVKRAPHEVGEKVVLEVTADGFLYNMVRAIVGTLVDIGRGALAEEAMSDIIAARDRRMAGQTAPPQGLFLVNVEYG